MEIRNCKMTKDLQPVKKIEPQPWMKAPETGAVMAALNDGFEKPQAFFVGGCVRNLVLGEEVEDIDIATRLPPQKVIDSLEKAGIKAIPTGIKHGTITAVSGTRSYEITTLRRDMETDGRHAIVEYTDDWREDVARRDFTMNTLLAGEDGQVYDPLGEGLADLKAGRVKFVGDPACRIAEDYLRILRFFRFHLFYGRGDINPPALKACRKAADKIATLSRERITQEFLKILSADDPEPVLKTMFDNNILSALRFPACRPGFLSDVCACQARYGLRFLAARLLVLAGLEKNNIETMRSWLVLPNVFLKDIEAISAALGGPALDNDHAVRETVYRCGRTAAAQALMIELAQDRVMHGYAKKALEIIQNWDVPDFPLSGEDLLEAGYTPGPALGRKLAEIESWWVAQDFTPGKQACLEYLRRSGK